jgi:hypothetical protein
MLIICDTFHAYKDVFLALFNRILSEGKIHRIWKLAIVTPVHKKGPKDSVSNYRPVSDLCSLSKLFERCLLELIDCRQLEGEHQHGFRSNRSTVTAMLEIESVIEDALDENKKVLMYSTDLSAAFDMLRPGILGNVLKKSMPSKVTCLILDFLSDRSYKVKLGTSLSLEIEMKIGCAQGSTIGPKLFSMYCGGLSRIICERVIWYADDSYVLLVGNDIEELKERASTTMKKHVEWFTTIGMVVNVDKTEAVIFSKSYVSPILLTVNGESFSTRDTMKVLGVTFDSKLKWDVHVNNVVKSAKSNIHGLCILRRNLSEKLYLKILTSQFFAKMYYGSVV